MHFDNTAHEVIFLDAKLYYNIHCNKVVVVPLDSERICELDQFKMIRNFACGYNRCILTCSNLQFEYLTYKKILTINNTKKIALKF
jgi:hypothetical protein